MFDEPLGHIHSRAYLLCACCGTIIGIVSVINPGSLGAALCSRCKDHATVTVEHVDDPSPVQVGIPLRHAIAEPHSLTCGLCNWSFEGEITWPELAYMTRAHREEHSPLTPVIFDKRSPQA